MCSFSLSSQSVTLKNMWWIECNVEITLYEANTSIAWFLYTSIPWVLWFLKTWIARFLNSWIIWFLSTLIPWFISIKGCIFAWVWVEPLFPSQAAKVNDKQTTKRVEFETKKKPFHFQLWKLSALGRNQWAEQYKPTSPERSHSCDFPSQGIAYPASFLMTSCRTLWSTPNTNTTITWNCL